MIILVGNNVNDEKNNSLNINQMIERSSYEKDTGQ